MLKDKNSGKVYTDAEIVQMREALEAETGFDLSDMSDRGIVANYLSREATK